MRRKVLLTVAGVASLFNSICGVLMWVVLRGWAPISHPVATQLSCAFITISIGAWLLYRVRPVAGLAVAWIILSGSNLSLYFGLFSECFTRPCSTANSVQIAWSIVTRNPAIWAMLLVPAVCLLLDYSAPTPIEPPYVTTLQVDDQDRGK